MSRQKHLSKRTRRYIGAVIATFTTTLTALLMLPEADAQTCTLHDATNWQMALHDGDVEQSPEYVRSVTEAFLNTCPDRPEFSEASRIAGMSAVDMQDAESAVDHFSNAGPMRDLLANFYAIAAFHKVGDRRTSWRVRDQMVEAWRSRLDRHPLVSVSAEPQQHGMIYQLYFQEIDHETGTRAAWVAVPDGPGWPAALSFSQDRMRLALRKARAAKNTDFRYVDLDRCHGRRTLGRIDTVLATSDFDAAARASLNAYLAKPDQPSTRKDDRVEVCVLPSRLLPSVPKP